MLSWILWLLIGYIVVALAVYAALRHFTPLPRAEVRSIAISWLWGVFLLLWDLAYDWWRRRRA